MSLTTDVLPTASVPGSVPTQAPPLSWQPPPVESLNLSRDCQVAADWFSSPGYDFRLTVLYVQSALPAVRSNETTTANAADFELDFEPDYYQLLEWISHDYLGDQVLLGNMAIESYVNCGVEICHTMTWPGSADLAGIGMVLTYYAEAILATLHFFVLAVDRFLRDAASHHPRSSFSQRHPPFRPSPRKASFSLIDALRGSADSFLDGAVLFAGAMLVAGVFENAYAARSYGKDTFIYETLLSLLLPVFSLFPAALLHGVVVGQRRVWLRRAIWITLGILGVSVAVLATSTFHAIRGKQSGEATATSTSDQQGGDALAAFDNSGQAWELLCMPADTVGVRVALKVTAVVVGVGGLLWAVFVANFLRVPALEKYRALVWLRGVWWIVISALALGAMWTYLVLFTRYRRLIVDRAGPAPQDTKWTFGQVLALATWLPVAIDFVYIFLFGSKEGLEGRLPKDWVIRHRDEPVHTGYSDKIPLISDEDTSVGPAPPYEGAAGVAAVNMSPFGRTSFGGRSAV